MRDRGSAAKGDDHMNTECLKIRGLKFVFYSGEVFIKAVEGVDLDVHEGECVAIVGESGCGKSVTSLSLMQLVQRPQGQTVEGEIRFNSGDKVYNIVNTPITEMQKLRGNAMSMIFQEPMTSLNPVFRIGEQVDEIVALHNPTMSKEEVKARTIEMLKLVGIANIDGVYRMYPHELSGGMRQRICIAIGLAFNPRLIIADEPTTALDVTIQAQILDLLRMIQQELDTATILVSHDLGVVARVADRVAIMYAGKIVEIGTAKEIFYDPRHPYTWGLMQSLPGFSRGQSRLHTIPGMPPSMVHLPKGDAFAARNEYALGIDYEQEPPMFQITKTHYAATWLLDKRAPKIECPIKRGRNDE